MYTKQNNKTKKPQVEVTGFKMTLHDCYTKTKEK